MELSEAAGLLDTTNPGILPPGVLKRPEDLRLALRKRACESTYFMAKAVIGFKDLTPSCHSPFGEFMDRPSTRKFGLAPRDHLKTSIWTIADSVRRIAQDPNIRILLANETATNAQHMLRKIESVFERCAAFQWLFPELIPDFSKVKKWSETEMLVPRSEDFPESTVETIGVGGAVVSRHYNLIKLDDLVGKEASESDEVMRKTIDWYQYCESLLNAPIESIHVYGTRWSHRDLYSWVEEHEPYVDKFFRAAVTPEGDALWPERWPLEELERIQTKNPYKFSCQYMNAPYDPEGGSFRTEWLNYYHLDSDSCLPELGSPVPIKKLRRFLRVDPAVGESDRACRTAILVDGVDDMTPFRVFLLEAYARRVQPLDMIDEIFRLDERWNPEGVWIESVAYQKAIKPFLLAECERRKRWLNVQELRPESGAKKPVRIRGLQPYFKSGQVFVRKDQENFLGEYAAYPFGQTVDLLDAFAYGPQVWGPNLDDEVVPEDDLWNEYVPGKTGVPASVTGY